MHIYITGGSGRNGSLAIKAALEKGHTITALVRNPSKIAPQTGLYLVKGIPQSASDVRKALTTPKSPSAILYTLNAPRTTESPFSPLRPDSPADLLSSTVAVLLSAISELDISPKIVVNSTQGIGSSWSKMIFPVRMLFKHSTMMVAITDHNRVDAMVRASSLNFVLARPTRLVEGPITPVRVWPDDGTGSPWFGSITRESVALWMVNAAESAEWDRKAPVITN